MLRRVFVLLETRGVLDRTWVVVTSDRGRSFGEGGFVTHSLSDQGDREASRHVPMVWTVPGTLRQRRTVSEEVSLMDVAPTIYDLTGKDWAPLKALLPEGLGRSLVPFLAGKWEPASRVAPKLDPTLGGGEYGRLRREAMERLRALAYTR